MVGCFLSFRGRGADVRALLPNLAGFAAVTLFFWTQAKGRRSLPMSKSLLVLLKKMAARGIAHPPLLPCLMGQTARRIRGRILELLGTG